MRVTLVTMQYGRGYSQGTERYLSTLVRHLRPLGVEPTVLAGDPEGRSPAEDGFARIPTHGWMTVNGRAGDDTELARAIESSSPDLIHVLNPAHVGIGAIAWADRRSVPTVVTVMDFWWVCPTHTLLRDDGHICGGARPWRECASCIAGRHDRPGVRAIASLPVLGGAAASLLVRAASSRRSGDDRPFHAWSHRSDILKAALESASAVIAPSRAAESMARRHAPAAHVTRLPYGVEPFWFDGQRRTGQSFSSPARLGYAGALAEHKGVDDLLEAVAMLPRDRAVLDLAGPASEAVRRRVDRPFSGASVRYLGPLDAEALRSWLGEIDLLVVPSQWPENLPLIMLEAAAVGTPVIGSNVEGIAEYVPRDALFEPRNPRALATVLRAWLDIGQTPSPPPPPTFARDMARATLTVYESATRHRGPA
ncbi:MAG: glycosyltransferase [Planctomycetota bacterium]